MSAVPVLSEQADGSLRGFPSDPIAGTAQLSRILAASPVSTRTALMYRLQQTHGNAFVQRFLAVQRCGLAPCNCVEQDRAATQQAIRREADEDEDEDEGDDGRTASATDDHDSVADPGGQWSSGAGDGIQDVATGSSEQASEGLNSELSASGAGSDFTADGESSPRGDTGGDEASSGEHGAVAEPDDDGPVATGAGSDIGSAAELVEQPAGQQNPAQTASGGADGPRAAAGFGCHYDPGERQKSQDSGGQFLLVPNAPFTDFHALVFDFVPGRAVIREHHEDGIRDVVARFRLDDDQPLARITLLEGFTDCVDSETTNSPLRSARAGAVFEAFMRSGAKPTNVGQPSGATSGELPGTDTDAEGRARNRSVLVFFNDVIPDEDKKPPDPEQPTAPNSATCDAMTDAGFSWFLGTTVSGQGGALGAGGAIHFFLKNRLRSSNCIYQCVFIGGGEGFGFGFGPSLPSLTPFETFHVFPAKEFDGPADVIIEGVSKGPVTFSKASLKLKPDTNPDELDIGGFSFGPSNPGPQAFIMHGHFHVFQTGFRSPFQR
jgi:hypothetical protein